MHAFVDRIDLLAQFGKRRRGRGRLGHFWRAWRTGSAKSDRLNKGID
jgi:hypothetical protein